MDRLAGNGGFPVRAALLGNPGRPMATSARFELGRAAGAGHWPQPGRLSSAISLDARGWTASWDAVRLAAAARCAWNARDNIVEAPPQWVAAFNGQAP